MGSPARKSGLTAEQWNERYPVGTRVRFRHAAHLPWIETKTRSEAWELGDGTPIVKVEGIAGGVAIQPEWMEVVGG